MRQADVDSRRDSGRSELRPAGHTGTSEDGPGEVGVPGHYHQEQDEDSAIAIPAVHEWTIKAARR